jgi:hypothetical protein
VSSWLSTTFWEEPDDRKWAIICDAESDQHVPDRPQFSLVPSEFYRQFIRASCFPRNPEGRFWLHGYALVALTRDGIIESLPEHITPLLFAEATQFGFTDWWEAEGLLPDFDCLLRNFVLEFPQGRVRVAQPKGASLIRKSPLSLD